MDEGSGPEDTGSEEDSGSGTDTETRANEPMDDLRSSLRTLSMEEDRISGEQRRGHRHSDRASEHGNGQEEDEELEQSQQQQPLGEEEEQEELEEEEELEETCPPIPPGKASAIPQNGSLLEP